MINTSLKLLFQFWIFRKIWFLRVVPFCPNTITIGLVHSLPNISKTIIISTTQISTTQLSKSTKFSSLYSVRSFCWNYGNYLRKSQSHDPSDTDDELCKKFDANNNLCSFEIEEGVCQALKEAGISFARTWCILSRVSSVRKNAGVFSASL